jgi:hypothetical protein
MKTTRVVLPLSVLIALLLGGLACSTAKVRVLPGENGVNEVAVRDIEKDGAEEAAVKGANEYCEKQGRHAVYLSNTTQYQGTMDESTRKTVRNASRAAMILGPGVGLGTSSGTAGGVLGGAGVVGHQMTNDRDYFVSAKFKCQ